jgi:hypothetical protein
MKYSMVRLLAIFVTGTATLMATIAAINRGGTFIEQALLVSISIIMVLAVHFLPAISRRTSSWILWFGCLLCAIFGHLTFLTHSTIRAGEVRVQQSALMSATQNQILATRSALDAISARPVVVVAAEIAQTNSWRESTALREELKQAKRADALRDELMRLSAVTSTTLITNATDPVTSRVAAVTGLSEAAITIGVGLLFSILLELTGTFLWFEALRDKPQYENTVQLAAPRVTTSVTTAVTTQVTRIVDDVSQLREAIQLGQCRTTVASIRSFLNCSQQKAMTLRREIIEHEIC